MSCWHSAVSIFILFGSCLHLMENVSSPPASNVLLKFSARRRTRRTQCVICSFGHLLDFSCSSVSAWSPFFRGQPSDLTNRKWLKERCSLPAEKCLSTWRYDGETRNAKWAWKIVVTFNGRQIRMARGCKCFKIQLNWPQYSVEIIFTKQYSNILNLNSHWYHSLYLESIRNFFKNEQSN